MFNYTGLTRKVGSDAGFYLEAQLWLSSEQLHLSSSHGMVLTDQHQFLIESIPRMSVPRDPSANYKVVYDLAFYWSSQIQKEEMQTFL